MLPLESVSFKKNHFKEVSPALSDTFKTTSIVIKSIGNAEAVEITGLWY